MLPVQVRYQGPLAERGGSAPRVCCDIDSPEIEKRRSGRGVATGLDAEAAERCEEQEGRGDAEAESQPEDDLVRATSTAGFDPQDAVTPHS